PRRAGRPHAPSRRAGRRRVRRRVPRSRRRVVGGVTALSLLAGVGCGLGVLLLVLGLRDQTGSIERVRATSRRGDQRGAQRVAVAVGVGLVVLVITRWPVGGLLAAAVVGSWHTLFG